MTDSLLTPDPWFRAGIPCADYELDEEVDEQYQPVVESFKAGGVDPATQASSFLSWVVLRDGLYRQFLAQSRGAFLQDGITEDPDFEVDANSAEALDGAGPAGLDAALDDILGREPAPTAETDAPVPVGDVRRHPAPGNWNREGDVVRWRERLSERHSRLWEWVPPSLWVGVTLLLLTIGYATGFGNPVGHFLMRHTWPAVAVLGVGFLLVRSRARKLRDGLQSRNDSAWRPHVRRAPINIGPVRVRVAWPVWVWAFTSLSLFLALPLPAAALLSLALMWSPLVWPAEQRRRLVASFKGERPPVTLNELLRPNEHPDPMVPGLEQVENHPAGAGRAPQTPSLTRLSLPTADSAFPAGPALEIAAQAGLPERNPRPVDKVAATLLLEMWSAATGSALPMWSARFGVWSSDTVGKAAAYSAGLYTVGVPAPPREKVWPSRCVAAWWEEESEVLQELATRHLSNEEAAAALAAAAAAFLPGEEAHIPRMVRLRAETLMYAALSAAERLG